MDPVLVVARHPHVFAAGSGGVEQTQELGAEPARSGGLPHTSHALGSGGVAETEQQRCRVATSGQGLKPSNSAHKVGLQLVVGVSPNVGTVAAVIDDDATHGVGDMGSGGVEVCVATRDNGGAKGVTITTGCNKQLHYRLRHGRRRGPVLTWAPPCTCKQRDGEAGERLIRQQLLADYASMHGADAGIFPCRTPTRHGRVGSETGRGWKACRPHLSLQQQAPPSLLGDRVCEGGSHSRVDPRRSTNMVIRHVWTIL